MPNSSTCPACGAPIKNKATLNNQKKCHYCGYQFKGSESPDLKIDLEPNPNEYYRPDPPPQTGAEPKRVDVPSEVPASREPQPEISPQKLDLSRKSRRLVFIVIVGVLFIGCGICIALSLLSFSGN